MKEDYKVRPSQMIELSLLTYLILVVITLPWIKNIFEVIFKEEVSLMIIGYLSLFIVVTLLLFLFMPKMTYSINERMAIKKRKFLKNTTTTYSYYKKDEIMIERVDSRIRNFFYESRLTIINKRGKKIFNIVLDKGDALKLSDELNGSSLKEKAMYEKDKDFVYSTKNVIETLLDPTKWFFFIFIINTAIIDLIGYWSIDVLRGRYPIVSSSIIITLYILALVGRFIHTSNTTLKIDDNTYRLSRGRIERENITFPAKSLSSFTIKYSFFGRHFGIYDINYIKNHKSILKFPFSASNFNALGGNYDRFRKVNKDRYYFLFVVKLIFFTGLSVWCMFFRLYLGIILEILSIYYSILTLNSWISYSDNSIIIRTHLFSTKFYVMPKKEILMVRMIRLPFNHTYVKFIGQNITKGIVLNKENTDMIKSILGYYK